MHALGFEHQHQRPNRDQFVSINWDRVNGENDSFDIRNFDNFDTPYDFHSIMHHSSWESGLPPAMVPYDRRFLYIAGIYNTLSSGDILRLNRMYDCEITAGVQKYIDLSAKLEKKIDDNICEAYVLIFIFLVVTFLSFLVMIIIKCMKRIFKKQACKEMSPISSKDKKKIKKMAKIETKVVKSKKNKKMKK